MTFGRIDHRKAYAGCLGMAAILAQAVQDRQRSAQHPSFGGADAAAALRAFFRQYHAWLSQLLAQLAGHQTDDAFMERRIAR